MNKRPSEFAVTLFFAAIVLAVCLSLQWLNGVEADTAVVERPQADDIITPTTSVEPLDGYVYTAPEHTDGNVCAEPEEVVYDDYEPEAEYYGGGYDYGGYADGSGLTPQSGVNYYGGNRETYYSSNVLYHYRTGEWTVGADGVYRDSDGYVVVASSDLAQGSTLDTSMGPAKVYDSGCASGTVDVYTNW